MISDFFHQFLIQRWLTDDFIGKDMLYLLKYVKKKEHKIFFKYMLLRNDDNVNYFTPHTGFVIKHQKKVQLLYLMKKLIEIKNKALSNGDIDIFKSLESGRYKFKSKKDG